MAEIYFAIPGDIDTFTGGYGYDRRLIAELRALGHNVTHLGLSNRFPFPDADAHTEAVATFAALPDQSIVIVDGLAYGVLDEIAAQHAARLNIIALCHHPLMLEAGLSATQAEQLFLSEQRALFAAKAVLVTSAITAKILVEQFSLSAKKISVALPGTDRQVFAPCNGDPPVLLTLATLTRRKAHDQLIDALAKIQHLGWCCRFVGGMDFDSAWTSVLKNKVAACGLEERILFVGNVTDAASEYLAADVFVLPSLYEGYGMAFAEALSFGLPIIAARAGAVPDVVPDSAGILVEPNNSSELAAALQKVLVDNLFRQHLQIGAQAAAHNLSDWANTAVVVERLINKIRSDNFINEQQEKI